MEQALVELQADRGLDQTMVTAFIQAVRQQGFLDSLESATHIYRYENRRAFYRY